MLGNFRLKLLAIFFAVALWSVVAYTSNPTQSKTYFLHVDHGSLPAGLVIVGDPPTVKANVIATADSLRAFDSRSLRAVGNFANVKVGTNAVPIRVDNTDSAVQVEAPGAVQVTIDQQGSATLNVTLQRVHSLLAGYHEVPNSASVTPPAVQVQGPKSLLSGLQAVVHVELDGVSAPGVNQTYPVAVLDAKGRDMTKSLTVVPANVTVKMTIQADAITLDKAVGFTLSGQPASGYRVTGVTVTPLQVQATGLQNSLGAISVLQTDPVDVSNAKSDIVRTVNIRPPDGVTISPKTASIHVFISPIPGVSPSSSSSP